MSELVAAMPFAERLGLRVDAATKDEVCGSLDWAEELCTAGGVLHGGALMAAADSVGALCAYLNLPDGATTATIESKTNFFRAVRGGSVTLTATPLHIGRSSIVVQTDVRDAEGRRVALVIQTQAVQL
jgi:uncharacterized protein (TIGR00369 family)